MKSKILIVEDNEINLLYLKEILNSTHQFEIFLLQEGIEAFQIAKKLMPDLILLDIQLPDKDGYEICRELKSDETTQPIPVIFLTAFNKPEDKVKGFQLGGSDYITKPVNREELISRMNIHLKLYKLQNELIKTNEQLEEKVKSRTKELEITSKRLQESEILHRSIFENALDAMSVSKRGTIIYSNLACYKLFGYNSNDTFTDKNILEFIAPQYHPEVIENIKKRANSSNPSDYYDLIGIKKDGTFFNLEINNSGFSIDDQIYTLSILRDISERKKKLRELEDYKNKLESDVLARTSELLIKNRKLEESEKRLEILAESSFEGICIIENETIIDANDQMAEMFQYKLSEIIGKQSLDLVAPESLEMVKKALKERKDIHYERWAIRKDKSVFPIEIQNRFITIENKKLLISTLRDLTEQKNFERKIVNTIIKTEEREKERFAQEIHDGIGPMISTTKLYLQCMVDEKTDKKDYYALKAIDILNETHETLKEIANNLSPHMLRNFGLSKAIETFINKINVKNNNNIDFSSNINSRLEINVETNLYRVICELINNTLKYARANKIQIKLTLDNNLIQILYNDDGIGFDLNEESSVYQGLGLQNMKSRIFSIGGKITITTSKGHGMKVVIEIPYKP